MYNITDWNFVISPLWWLSSFLFFSFVLTFFTIKIVIKLFYKLLQFPLSSISSLLMAIFEKCYVVECFILLISYFGNPEDEMVRWVSLTQRTWIWTNYGDRGGQRSLARESPWGHKVDATWQMSNNNKSYLIEVITPATFHWGEKGHLVFKLLYFLLKDDCFTFSLM